MLQLSSNLIYTESFPQRQTAQNIPRKWFLHRNNQSQSLTHLKVITTTMLYPNFKTLDHFKQFVYTLIRNIGVCNILPPTGLAGSLKVPILSLTHSATQSATTAREVYSLSADSGFVDRGIPCPIASVLSDLRVWINILGSEICFQFRIYRYICFVGWLDLKDNYIWNCCRELVPLLVQELSMFSDE